jgi:hypothetical protein
MMRYAWYGETSSAAQPIITPKKDVSRFFLFDYYDEMCHIRFDKKSAIKYTAVMGIEDPFECPCHPILSSQLLTLVELDAPGMENGPCPFQYKSDDENISDKPFLSLINVSMTPVCVTEQDAFFGDSFLNNEEAIFKFLAECTVVLRERADAANKASDGSAVFGVYYSMTSGNFFIAVRSASLHTAYQIADMVNATPYGNCLFHTFTTIGLEYRTQAKRQKQLYGFKETAKIEDYVIIRLSTSSPGDGLREVVKDMGEELYGRYDVTVKLPFNTFKILYPLLAYFKIEPCGHENYYKNIYIPYFEKCQEKNEEQKTWPVIKKLVEDIGKDILAKTNSSKIHYITINERVGLITPQGTAQKVDKAFDAPDWNRLIFTQNTALLDQLLELKKKEAKLPYNRKQYSVCLGLIKELIIIYGNARYAYDALINGFNFYSQMCYLLSSIKNFTDFIIKYSKLAISTEVYKMGMCEDLTSWLRKTVDSLNSYNKLLQSINLQSMQAPNYEIGMKIDAEKYLISYTEFLRSFIADYKSCTLETPANKEKPKPIFPIFTVDFSVQSINATALFNYPVDVIGQEVIAKEDLTNRVVLAITTPDFNTFVSLYATLPLLCHEIGHYLRFGTREERNLFVAKYTFRYISEYMAKLWLSKSNENHSYFYAPRVLTNFLAKAIFDEMWATYTKKYIEKIANRNLPIEIEFIRDFLFSNFFIKHDDYIFSNPEQGDKKALREILKKLYQMAIPNIPDDQAKSDMLKTYRTVLESGSIFTTVNKDQVNELITYFTDYAYDGCYNRYIQIGIIERYEWLLLESIYADAADNNFIAGLPGKLRKFPLPSEKLIDPCRYDLRAHIMKALFGLDWASILFEFQRLPPALFNAILCFYHELPGLLKTVITFKQKDETDIFIAAPSDICTYINTSFDALAPESLPSYFEEKSKEACIALNDKLDRLKEAFRKELTRKKQNSLIEKLDNISYITFENLKSFWQISTDINRLHTSASSAAAQLYRDRYSMPPVSDEFIASLHTRLRASYKRLSEVRLNNTGDMSGEDIGGDLYTAVMLNSKETYAVFSPLCISFPEDEGAFGSYFKQAMFSANDNQINEMIDSYVSLSGEILSDLCMCAAVRFTPFGYLRFFAQCFGRTRQPSPLELQDAESIRAAMVIAVLIRAQAPNLKEPNEILRNNDAGFDKLIHDVGKHVVTVLKALSIGFVKKFETASKEYIKKICTAISSLNLEDFISDCKSGEKRLPGKITDAYTASAETKDFIEYLYVEVGLALIESVCNQNMLSESSDFINGFYMLQSTRRDKVIDYFQRFVGITQRQDRTEFKNNAYDTNIDAAHYLEYITRLDSMVIYLFGMKAIDPIRDAVSEELFEAFYTIYFNKIKKPTGDIGCRWENQVAMQDIRLNIGNYYNKPIFRNLSSISFNEIFYTSLPFFLYYFYRDRHRYGNAAGKAAKKLTAMNNAPPKPGDVDEQWLTYIEK